MTKTSESLLLRAHTEGKEEWWEIGFPRNREVEINTLQSLLQ